MEYVLMKSLVFSCFFQAEDGIRDADVTGVQTCALPIYKRALGSVNRIDGRGQGDTTGNLDIDYQACLAPEDDLQVIFSVANRGDLLEIGPHVTNLVIQELQGVVDKVGTPVVKLAAAFADKRLPVVTTLIAVASKLDLEHVAQYARGDNFLGVHEGGFETSIVADEKLSASLRGLLELLRVVVCQTYWFFEEYTFTFLEGSHCCGKVIVRAIGNAHQFDLFVVEQFLKHLVDLRFWAGFGKSLPLLGQWIAGGDYLEFPGACLEILKMHA